MNDIIDIGEAPVPAVYEERADIDKEIVDDIEEARETYKDLITKGKEGLDIAYTVMEGSQHPRATETFAGLLNAIASINKNLVELQTVKRNTRKESKEESPRAANIVQNNFVGTPADLQTLIRGMMHA